MRATDITVHEHRACLEFLITELEKFDKLSRAESKNRFALGILGMAVLIWLACSSPAEKKI